MNNRKSEPREGGPIAWITAFGRFVYRLFDISGSMAEKFLLDITVVVLMSHILHHVGVPMVPDLLPFVPALNSISSN